MNPRAQNGTDSISSGIPEGQAVTFSSELNRDAVAGNRQGIDDVRMQAHTLLESNVHVAGTGIVKGAAFPEGKEMLADYAVTAFERPLHVMENETNVDLRKEFAVSRQVVSSLRDHPEAHIRMVDALVRAGKLEGVFPVCYRTDRDNKMYGDRYGLDLEELIRGIGEPGAHKLILEYGQGSGECMEQRRPTSEAAGLIDAGICDRIRFQLDTMFFQMLDFEALPPLSAEHRKLLAKMLYKLLVIEAGKTGEDFFPYDEEVRARIAADPRAIPEEFFRKAPLLLTTETYPADGGGLDERDRIVYRKKDNVPDDAQFRTALEMIARDPARFLKAGSGPGKLDARLFIPVFPAGTVTGDFRALDRLAPGQVDGMTFGVNSSQGLQGKDYEEFLRNDAALLGEHAFALNDDIRKIFGRYYALQELVDAERDTGCPIYVIVGPGQPGENFNAERAPLARLMTRDAANVERVRALLRPGFGITTAGELLADAAYMRSLYRPR